MRVARLSHLRRLITGFALLSLVLGPLSNLAVANPPGPYIAINRDDPRATFTPSELAILRVKEALFQQHWAQQRAAHPDAGRVSAFSVPNPGGSWPFSGSLSVAAKQQEKYYYCGPASTQAVEAFRNGSYHSQTTIAGTEQTDAYGFTYVYLDRTGLNTYVSQPSGFIYAEYQPASDGEWWARLQEDVAGYSMPQVVTVAPHDPGVSVWLPSWPTAITAGHYVVVSAYSGYNYSDAGSSVTYVDSSAGFSGGTGVYSTSATTMRATILEGNAQHAANWIIW